VNYDGENVDHPSVLAQGECNIRLIVMLTVLVLYLSFQQKVMDKTGDLSNYKFSTNRKRMLLGEG
jgi:hypothetical protein